MQIIDSNFSKANPAYILPGNNPKLINDSDKAFNEFCKKYLNSSNGFLNYKTNNINNTNINNQDTNSNTCYSIYNYNFYHNNNNNNSYNQYYNNNVNNIMKNSNLYMSNLQTANNVTYLTYNNNNINKTEAEVAANVQLRNNKANSNANYCATNNLIHDLDYYKKRNSQILMSNTSQPENSICNHLIRNNTINQMNSKRNSNLIVPNVTNETNRNSTIYPNYNNINDVSKSLASNQNIISNSINNTQTKTQTNCKRFSSINLKDIYNSPNVSKEKLAQFILDVKQKSAISKNIKGLNSNNTHASYRCHNNIKYGQQYPVINSQPQVCHYHSNHNIHLNRNLYSPAPSVYANSKSYQNYHKNNNLLTNASDNKISLRNLKSSSNSTNHIKRFSLLNEDQTNKARSANNSLVFKDSKNIDSFHQLQDTKSANSLKLTLSNDESNLDSSMEKNSDSFVNIIKTITNKTNKLCQKHNISELSTQKTNDSNSNLNNSSSIKLTKSNNNSYELIDTFRRQSTCIQKLRILNKNNENNKSLLKSEACSYVRHKLVNLKPIDSNRSITPPPPPIVVYENKVKSEENLNGKIEVEAEINKDKDLKFSSNSSITVNSNTSYEEKSIDIKPESISSISSSTNSTNSSESEKEEEIPPFIDDIITNIRGLKFNQNSLKEKAESIISNNDSIVKVNNAHKQTRLGFKVFACGMNKLNPKLPIPKDNFFIDRGDFGDDAGFFSENLHGHAIGIADGATGNAIYGYDPGDFSRNLMKACSEYFIEENRTIDAKSLLMKAYDAIQEKTCYGSSTACVITLDHEKNTLTATNVGDSGYIIIRNGKILHKSEPQRINFVCPRQLDSYPWKEKSRKMGVSYTNIIADQTDCDTIQAIKDDIVIISSDGLFDNLDYSEIEEIFLKSKTICDAVETMVFRSVKYYRKPDDILVICGKIIENANPLIQQKFTQDPYLV